MEQHGGGNRGTDACYIDPGNWVAYVLVHYDITSYDQVKDALDIGRFHFT